MGTHQNQRIMKTLLKPFQRWSFLTIAFCCISQFSWSYAETNNMLKDGSPSQDECPPVWDCPALGANIGDACDDGDYFTFNDEINADCECEGTGSLVYFNCSDEPLTETYCYGNNGDHSWVYVTEVQSEGPTLSISFESGFIEGGYDDITIYDGMDSENEILFTTTDFADGSGPLDLAELVNVTSSSYAIYIVLTSNNSVSCEQGSADYAGGWEWTVSCNADCPELPANFGGWCNDGNPYTFNDQITEDCECEGTSILVWDCPALAANIGDACDDGDPYTEYDAVNVDCICEGTPVEPLECPHWALYINDNEGGETDIYGIIMIAGNAELYFITTVGFHGHMAYNNYDQMLYVLNNTSGNYVQVDPISGSVSEPYILSQEIPSITTAAFAPNGKLLVGSATQNVIYSIDMTDNSVSVFDAYAPINGGDIAFDSTGMLYLASRSGNGFYEVHPDDVLADQLIGTIPSLVTGMAMTESNQLLTSHNGNTELYLHNRDGSSNGVTYPLMLNSDPFIHHNGDLASGSVFVAGCGYIPYCDYLTFYADNNRPGVVGTDLYSVDFTADGNADMTFLTNIPFNGHIAYDPENGFIFIVKSDGSKIRGYDLSTGVSLGELPITDGPTDIVAVVYSPEDGLLYVGSSDSDDIYTIDLGTGAATYLQDAPVEGGDLAIQDGNLYLATRTGSALYEITGGGADLLGSIPPLVNGMARASNSTDLVITNKFSDVFTRIFTGDGSTIETYVATINGEAVMLYDGDMAAGCVPFDYSTTALSTYYASEIGAKTDGATQDGEDDRGPYFNNASTLTSFPNPTKGEAKVEFRIGKTGRTLVEVYDMNGRNVSTLFNQVAQTGQKVRLDFDSSDLPNGVYIIKMTTVNEIITEKFMIAR